ncbi:MAG: nucleoside kinase [Bacteroidales bacterium]|jgi:uridine kinase|nr:nucleoside kinase [Bacteroidales bacterium]
MIEILCKNNGVVKKYEKGITLREIANDQNITLKGEILGANINNQLRELSYGIYENSRVSFVDITSTNGYMMYIRSLFFVLYKAIDDIYPKASFHVEHSLPYGFYCEIENLHENSCENLCDESLKKIKKRVEEIIEMDIPFIHQSIPTEEVIELYREKGFLEKVALFETRNQLFSSIYKLEDKINYFYNALLPSTGYIKQYSIEPYCNGIIVSAPRTPQDDVANGNNSAQKDAQMQLFEIFQEHKKWLEILGVPYLGYLNKKVLSGESGRLIKISEALHEKKIAFIADKIKEHQSAKVVLISGPSSSGKTTFSKRLGVHLQVLGFQTQEISLDNYFVDREHTPKDENGDYDFEALEALDIEFFNEQLAMLLSKENAEVEIPAFDFKTGKRTFKGDKIKMTPKTILIIEGIHALNPSLTNKVARKLKYNIFCSALTHITIDSQNLVKSTDNRMLRRIVRDYHYRGYSATETIRRWDSVRKGENKYIFPYQAHADIMFNSALLFELGVIKKVVEPLLQDVPQTSDEYLEAERLLKFLSYFKQIDATEIPPTSILREFLGGSSFRY